MVLWPGSCSASVSLRPQYRDTIKPKYLNSYPHLWLELPMLIPIGSNSNIQISGNF